MQPLAAPLRTGLARVLADPSLLPEGTIALATNYAAVTDDLGRGVDALLGAGVPVRALLTPEHGYWGAAQAGESDGDGVDTGSGLPVLDTHRVRGSDLDVLLGRSGVDQVVVDLQDIGTRFYTYLWSMYELMCAAARTGHPLVVLDRPNPLGARRVGPGLESAYESAIGRLSIPLQHGLSLGELALWFNAEHVPHATGKVCDLQVVTVQGWNRERQSEEVPWVMPSPNMPSLQAAILYPATGLIEGTTLSEGRGTTRPFELIGAPWLDQNLAGALREHDLPGISVREAVFRPTFSKCAGEQVHGVQLHLRDADAFDPIRTGLTLLSVAAALHAGEGPFWLDPFTPGRPRFIDLMWGSPALREGIDAGQTPQEILAASTPAPQPPEQVLLY